MIETCGPCWKGDHGYCHIDSTFRDAVDQHGLPYGMTERPTKCGCRSRKHTRNQSLRRHESGSDILVAGQLIGGFASWLGAVGGLSQ